MDDCYYNGRLASLYQFNSVTPQQTYLIGVFQDGRWCMEEGVWKRDQ
jgi:hypothetical protein